jgi:glycosyltransferase involved in cell wall biosynthesis
MPRIGMNPARNRLSGYHPARVTLAVLTHVPNQAGYFQHRFDVLRLCLESLIANTPDPYDLIVFDNGSSPEVVDYLRTLRDEGYIHYLLLSSQNIGKIGALQILFQAAPGEIIAYNDDDVFFLPGWLEEHMKILEAFPKVGMVTGFYIRSHMSYAVKTSLEFAKALPSGQVQRGMLIDRKWEQHYIDNMGRTWEKYAEEIQGCEDVAVTYQGVEALLSAGHHQFVTPKKVILEALPKEWGGQLMGRMLELDETIDQLGYLRLSTRQYVTRLLGNAVSEENAAVAKSLGLDINHIKTHKDQPGSPLASFYRLPLVHRLALAIYNRLHLIINS